MREGFFALLYLQLIFYKTVSGWYLSCCELPTYRGGLKKIHDSCYTRNQTRYLKRSWHVWQRTVIFAFMWLEAYERNEHSCGPFSTMAHLKNLSRVRVRGFIRFLWARKLSVAHNHRKHVEHYSNDVVSGQQVGKGRITFASGRRNITDAIDVDGETPQWNKWTLYPSRNSVRRTEVQLFAACGVWTWFILGYSEASGGGCVIAPKWQEMWPVSISTTLCSVIKRLCSVVSCDGTWVRHFTPTSKRSTMQYSTSA